MLSYIRHCSGWPESWGQWDKLRRVCHRVCCINLFKASAIDLRPEKSFSFQHQPWTRLCKIFGAVLTTFFCGLEGNEFCKCCRCGFYYDSIGNRVYGWAFRCHWRKYGGNCFNQCSTCFNHQNWMFVLHLCDLGTIWRYPVQDVIRLAIDLSAFHNVKDEIRKTEIPPCYFPGCIRQN